MVIFSVLWIFFSILVVSSQKDEPKRDEESKKGNEELIFVTVVARHGLDLLDFVHSYKLLQKKPPPEGMVQMFKFGRKLKQRYVDIDPPFFNVKDAYSEIHTQSLYRGRCIKGSQALLAAMFPTKESPVLEQLNGAWPSHWMPMPVHSMPAEDDIKLNLDIKCPNFLAYTANMTTLYPVFAKLEAENQDFLAFLTQALNISITSDNVGLARAAILYEWDHLDKVRFHWVTEDVLEKMRVLSSTKLYYEMTDAKMIRLKGGVLITDLLQRMEAKWSLTQVRPDHSLNTTNILKWQKCYTYVSRSRPLMWQLSALGLNNLTHGDLPPFGSALLYELWSVGGKPHVSTFYYNGKTEEISELHPAQCPKTPKRCPLTTFHEIMAPFLIDDSDDWRYNICGLPKPTASSIVSSSSPDGPSYDHAMAPRYRTLAIVFASIIIFLTAIIVIQICVLMRPQRRQKYDTLSPAGERQF